jgi:hypothetical protein
MRYRPGLLLLAPVMVYVACGTAPVSPEVMERRALAFDLEKSSGGLLRVYATPDGPSPSLSLVLQRVEPGYPEAARKSGLLDRLRIAGYRRVTITTEVGLEPALGKSIQL